MSHFIGEVRAYGAHLFDDRVELVHLLYLVIITWAQCYRRFEVQVGFRAKGHKERDALFISVGQAISASVIPRAEH